jgi:hypothetical protein
LQTYRRENSCWKYLKISAAALNAGTWNYTQKRFKEHM